MIALIFAILLFFGAVTSMAETALFSLSDPQIQQLEKKQRSVKHLLERPRELLVSLLFVNTGVNLLVQNYASDLFGDEGGWLLKVGAPLLLTVLFAELVPKVLAMSFNEAFSIWLAPFVRLLLYLLASVCRFFSFASTFVAGYLFFFVRPAKPLTGKELLTLLSSPDLLSNSDQGIALSAMEGRLLGGLVKLQDAKVEDLMWPRAEMIYYDLQSPLKELEERFAARECSQIPICDGGLDQIVGILYATDLVALDQELTKERVRSLLKEPRYVPQNSKALSVLGQIQSFQEDLVLAVNEYGVISGLLTCEDLLERVVGEIPDARDRRDELIRLSGGGFVASASLALEELERELETPLPSRSSTTLGGFLCELHGDIAQTSTLIPYRHLVFRILLANERQILKVYIHEAQPQSARALAIKPAFREA